MSDTLLETIAIDRSRIAELIAEGRLDQAAYRCRQLADRHGDDPRCRADAALIDWLVEVDLPKDLPAIWRVALRSGPATEGTGSPIVVAAVREYLARGLVRAAEAKEGKGAFVEGEPAGAFLLEVGLAEEAAASLYASLARAHGSGRAALLLGNALLRLDRLEDARDAYRRAFRVAPFDIQLSEIEDLEVRGLAELASELALEGDVRVWLPAIGYLEDVLPFSALDPVPGAGFGDATRAYDLLVAHRGARSQGERMAIRRDLREIAPLLFDALLTSRKLDATPTPTGTA